MSTFHNYQYNKMKQMTNYTEKGILKFSCCLFFNLKDNFPHFFVKLTMINNLHKQRYQLFKRIGKDHILGKGRHLPRVFSFLPFNY